MAKRKNTDRQPFGANRAWVILSAEAYEAIRDRAPEGFHDAAMELDDGRWKIRVSADVLGRLRPHHRPGETIGDTILRLCRNASAGKLFNVGDDRG